MTATSLPDGFTENPILMFMLSSDKDQRKKNSLSHWLSISANESQNPYFSVVNKRRLQKQNKRDDRKREKALVNWRRQMILRFLSDQPEKCSLFGPRTCRYLFYMIFMM